jgi:hypothetical protein
MEEKLLLPSVNETAAIALKPKTAALCYDRVWGTSDDIVPRPIRCWGGTKAELSGKGLAADFNIKTNRAPIAAMIGPKEKQLEMLRASTDYGLAATFRDIAKSFSKEHGVYMVPIFDFIKQRDQIYQPGDRAVIMTTLSNLDIVDEKQVTWEQVMQFRSDEEMKGKYRRLLHWIDKEMIGNPQNFVEDEISQKLEDYMSALRKHGIKTVVGTVEEALDGRLITGASATAVAFANWGHPSLGILAGMGLIIGKVAVKLIKTYLDFDDIERGPNSEISWVYEVKKLSGKRLNSLKRKG